MTPRKSPTSSPPEAARSGWEPGRRLNESAPTVPRSYTLPFPVILELRRAAREYGSQGRALQVGSELLVRMNVKKMPEVPPPNPEMLMRMTYKLTPRTVRLIEELARTHYGDPAKAITACVLALKVKKID
jgi:hypothetical protein